MSLHSWKKIVRESVLFLIIISFVSIFAGITLEKNIALLGKFPVLLLITPSFIGICGGIAGTFSCRLTSKLQLGNFQLSQVKGEIFVSACASLVNTIIFFFLLSTLAAMISPIIGLGEAPIAKIVIATVLSGVVVVLASMLLAVAVAIFTIRHNLDPDNFESAVLSTFGDVVGVLTFISLSSLIIL